jgi:hypothetical protein
MTTTNGPDFVDDGDAEEERPPDFGPPNDREERLLSDYDIDDTEGEDDES